MTRQTVSRSLGLCSLAGLALLSAVYVATLERAPRIRVLWRDDVSAQQQAALEATYFLRNARDRLPEESLAYDLLDTSRANIRRLVEDPAVADTNDIDRTTYVVEPGTDRGDASMWLAYRVPGLRAAWVRWTLMLLLAAGAIAGLRRERAALVRRATERGIAEPIPSVGWRAASPLRCGACLAAAIFAAAFCWPLFGHAGELGVARDWDQHQLYHWVPYETVVRYGQIPLWNPFECGGMPMLANPQSRWLSPFFLLHVWLGPARAIPIEIVVHIALAWLGGFVLGRVLGLSRVAAAAPAVVFAGCSAFYLHLGEGHTGWLPYAYMPWTLAAYLTRRRFVAGVLLALAVGEGGIYAVPHTALVLGLLALHRSVTEESSRPLEDLALVGLAAVCLAAPKLLVMQELMNGRPRLISSPERMDLSLLFDALFSRAQDLTAAQGTRPYGFHEYGAYISPIAAALAIAGIVRQRRNAMLWLIVAVTALVLSLGETLGGEFSPWALLHRLPVFASQHVPSRFTLPAVLGLGVLAGYGADALAPRLGRNLLAVLLAAAALDAALVGTSNLRHVFAGPAAARAPAPTFVQFRDETSTRMYELARANMGALNCYEPLDPGRSTVGVNEPGYRGEQYLLAGGTATLIEWTPNRLVIDVAAANPDVLVINQNYHASWRLASGGQAMAHEGRLAVRIPPGHTRVTLGYRSTRFLAGLALAAGAVLVAGIAAVYRRRIRA